MNAQDRKELQALVLRLRTEANLLRDENFSKTEEEVRNILTDISDEVLEKAEAEHEKFDNMTDSLQESDRGQAIQEAADGLSSITWPDVSDFDLTSMEDRESLADDIDEAADEIEGLL